MKVALAASPPRITAVRSSRESFDVPSSAGRLRSLFRMPVFTGPGHSTETPMPCGSRSRRRHSVKPTTAYFEVV